MDEEESFAKLLSQSTTAAVPAWNDTPAEADPWANPFSDTTPSANPFASPFGTASAYVPASSADPYAAPIAVPPDSPRDEVSPYVTKLEEDEAAASGRRPDPPSVIAAREQAGFGDASIGQPPYSSFQNIHPASPPKSQEQQQQQRADKAERRGLPSDLIDEDLLAASDPSASLKKAFVKSTPVATKKEAKEVKQETESKAYVFTPAKKGSVGSEPKKGQEAPPSNEATSAKTEKEPEKAADSKVVPAVESEKADQQPTPTTAPTSIPLPDSSTATPTATRPVSPTPATSDEIQPSPVPFTPSSDHVAVSPLDPPPHNGDYGFQSLAIGGSSVAPPPPPTKSPVREPDNTTTDGWTASQATSTPSGSRFSGKGWAAVDDEVDDGLFGKGGPSIRSSAPAPRADLWGGGVTVDASEGGWGEPGVASLGSPAPSAGPSHVRTTLYYHLRS
jgi:sorting nexin-1/2